MNICFWGKLCKNVKKIREQENRPLRTAEMRFFWGTKGNPTHENFNFMRFLHSLDRSRPLR